MPVCTVAIATLSDGLQKQTATFPNGANGVVGLKRVAAGDVALMACDGLPRSAVRSSWKYS
jgi:hypothetical protein